MKFIWSILICLVFALPLSAQEKGSQNQQIEAVKVAFITQKLSLTSSQAEKFWPGYNNYQREMREVFKQRKEAKNRNDGKDGELDYESRLLYIRKKYKQEFYWGNGYLSNSSRRLMYNVGWVSAISVYDNKGGRREIKMNGK